MRTDRLHTLFEPIDCPMGGSIVKHDQGREARRQDRRERRSKRRDREAREARELEEELLLSPEERAIRRARRVAEEKTRLASELMPVLIGSGLLFFIGLWPVALLVLFIGGRKSLRRAYRLFLEPRIRQRFIEQEVEKQVHATLSQERRELEGEHARSMQQLSASIAHEIRNPITAAKSLVQQMEEDPTRRDNVEYARVALEELQRVERSVSHLLRFARDEDVSLQEVRLAEVIDSALETFRDRLERNDILLDTEIETAGRLRGDAEKLRRIVINLVGNAIDALVESGTAEPHVELTLGENLAGTEVWLRIRDNGPGIDTAAQQKMFSPFYTSKANGTGLGLAITRKLVDAHGGSIELHSEPGQGAEFVVTFPKAGGGEVRS
ncbi:MAG: two-component system sensor histidine kinase NtrB [Myxococcota bacterium]